MKQLFLLLTFTFSGLLAKNVSAQSNITVEELTRMPGHHISEPWVKEVLARNNFQVNMITRNLSQFSEGIEFYFSDSHYIEIIAINPGKYKGPLPYGFSAETTFGEMKKKLKKNGQVKKDNTIWVTDPENRIQKYSFLQNQKAYKLILTNAAFLKPVILGDRDHDGVLDYCDSCPDLPGRVYNFGCPLLRIHPWSDITPDSLFNEDFSRIYDAFELDFKPVLGNRLNSEAYNAMNYSVTKGIHGFSDEMIVFSDTIAGHVRYEGTYYFPNTVSAMEVEKLLTKKITEGQMKSVAQKSRVKYNYSYCNCTKISMMKNYGNYNQIATDIFVKSFYNYKPGYHAVRIYIGYNKMFY